MKTYKRDIGRVQIAMGLMAAAVLAAIVVQNRAISDQHAADQFVFTDTASTAFGQ